MRTVRMGNGLPRNDLASSLVVSRGTVPMTTRGSSSARRKGKSTAHEHAIFPQKILHAGRHELVFLGIEDDVEIDEQLAAAIHVAFQCLDDFGLERHARPGDNEGVGIIGDFLPFLRAGVFSENHVGGFVLGQLLGEAQALDFILLFFQRFHERGTTQRSEFGAQIGPGLVFGLIDVELAVALQEIDFALFAILGEETQLLHDLRFAFEDKRPFDPFILGLIGLLLDKPARGNKRVRHLGGGIDGERTDRLGGCRDRAP